MAISCLFCGSKLRVRITGGTFFVKESSTQDNLNFEVDDSAKILSPDGTEPDGESMLTVEVECQQDPSHSLFGTLESDIKREIFTRIERAAKMFKHKYQT